MSRLMLFLALAGSPVACSPATIPVVSTDAHAATQLPRPLPTSMTLKQCRDEITIFLDPQITSLNTTIAGLNAQVGQVTGQLTTCNANAAALSAQIASLTAQLSTKDAAIADGQATIAAQQSTIAQRDATIAGFAPTLAAKQAELDAANARVASLADPLQNLLDAMAAEGVTFDITVAP